MYFTSINFIGFGSVIFEAFGDVFPLQLNLGRSRLEKLKFKI